MILALLATAAADREVIACGATLGWVSVPSEATDVPTDHALALTTTNACDADGNVSVTLWSGNELLLEERLEHVGSVDLHELDIQLAKSSDYELVVRSETDEDRVVTFSTSSEPLGGLDEGPEIVEVVSPPTWSRRDREVAIWLDVQPAPRGFGLAVVELRDDDRVVWDRQVQHTDGEMVLAGSQAFESAPSDLALHLFQRGQDGEWVQGESHVHDGAVPKGCSSTPTPATMASLVPLILLGFARRRSECSC